MPPKAKLNKNKNKPTSKPPTISQNLEPEANLSNANIQAQFEVELVWCIQQLQTALSSGKLSEKQAQDNAKTLNSLTSISTPVIKKRQLMRHTFGDYRTKMAQEEKQLSKLNRKIVLKPGTPSSNSVFVKKAPFLTSGKDFRFNFQTSNTASQNKENQMQSCVEEMHKLNLGNSKNSTPFLSSEMQKLKLEDSHEVGTSDIQTNAVITEEFHYQPSNNSFRFNFNEE